MERFNRRVISALVGQRNAMDGAKFAVHLLRDAMPDIPPNLRDAVRGFAGSRLGFALASARAACAADTVLVGHINLLPVVAAAKAINPALRSVLFVHGVEVWNDPAYRRKRIWEPALLRAVDTVASVSRYTAERMQAQFGVPPDKFVILPNAVDGPINPRAASPRTQMLLTVTRMAEHDRGKNVDAILRAFAVVADRLPNASLVVVGDGHLRAELEAYAATLGLQQRVHFLGKVSDDELDACYGQAAAFVLPSSKEGFGIVYLEAWKHGLPVICGTEGAASEVVAHEVDGFVVDPADCAQLASAMETLLTDATLAGRLGSAGARKAQEHYTDSVFGQRLRNLVTEGVR